MQNKTFTRTVCRTGYGSRKISVSLPADATNEQIEDAILAEAPNHEFSDRDADYELLDAIGDSDARIQRVLCELMSKLNGIGFGRDAEINGADAVDAVDQAYEDALNALTVSRLSPMVIQSVSEDGFWNNDDGWGDLSNATHFFDYGGSMPMSADQDARLVRLADARVADET